MKIRLYIAVLLLTLSTPWAIYAQESEEDLNEKALALFEEESYAEASKIYSTLLSMNMQNAEYNFRFGACQLFTIEDKEEPLQYLKFATEQSEVPSLAYYYYGLGLHLNYRFDRAIEQYKKYQPLASKKEPESAFVDHYIKQCQDGKKLVSSFTDISVVQRSVLPRSDFYRNYDLSEFGGKIIVKPEDFMSDEDKKRDAKFLMYFQQESDLIYYASYSDKNETGKDLFFIQKLPTGGWSEPSKLPDMINTKFDEDYPFIHPEGSTLYFASKGHNSMGGYDIFKTERRGDGTWTQPVNMEFAINTPWDDFMFITDLEEKSAWFASNRETSNSQVTVYRIGMERIPLDLTLIKGEFQHEASRRIKITVEDLIQNKRVGVYVSDSQFGTYLLDLKGSGKYKFLVEAEESEVIHSGIVEIPREKGLKQFRQEMLLVDVDGQEQLQIINHFDDPIEDENLLTADILKKQASLSVNSSEDELERSVELLDDGSPGTQGGTSEDEEANRPEKRALAQRAVTTLQEETKTLNAKASTLYDVAQQKKNSSDPNEIAEASIAAELASMYRREAEKREVAIQGMESTLSLLDGNALDDAAFNAQYAQLAATKNNFTSLEKFESNVKEAMEKRLDPTLSEYESKRAEVEDLEDVIESIDEEIAYYKQEIENTKDDMIKEELQLQVAEAEANKPKKEASLDRASKELANLVTQKNNAMSYYDMTQDLLELADTYQNENLVKVDMRTLNNLQGALTEQAKNDPALLAFVAPEEARIAMNESLSESRKENDNDSSEDRSNNEEDNEMATTEVDSSSETTNENTTDGSDEGDRSELSLNEQIRAIEAQESQPDVVDGDYEQYFTQEIEQAGNAEDPIIAESRKAELYDQWAENIGVRIDSLKEEKRQTSDGPALVRIDDQIKELEAEKREKEGLAMESYQNIASLSDQAAAGGVAASSGETTESNEAINVNDDPFSNEVVFDASERNGNMEDGDQDIRTDASIDRMADQNNSEETEENLAENSTEEFSSVGLPPSTVSINRSFESFQDTLPPLTNNASADVKLKYAQFYNKWADSLTTELIFFGDLIANAETSEEEESLQTIAKDINEFRSTLQQRALDITESVDQKEMQEKKLLAQNDLQSQLYEYVENYNANAFQQIESQVERDPNPITRSAQLETLHKNWMIAIQNEKVKTEARIANTDNQQQKEALEKKVTDLNIQKSRVQNVLDSLHPEMVVDGPSAPSSVKVKGSERFEGYVQVEVESLEEYEERAEKRYVTVEELNAEIDSIQAQLDETKKKKKRREMEATMKEQEHKLELAKMESSFYEEAQTKLAAVETSVLTLEEGDLLPSQEQASIAAELRAEAKQKTQDTDLAMEEAVAIKKKKVRLPAIDEAKEMQKEAEVLRNKARLAERLAEEMADIEKATIEQNHIILPGKEVVLPTVERTLNPNEKEDVRYTVEYLDYNDQKVIADSIRREVSKLKQLQEQFTQRGQTLMERSAAASLDGSSAGNRMALAEQAYQDFEEADSRAKIIAQLTREATYIENEANRQLLSRPEEAYLNVLAYYNDEPRNAELAENVEIPSIDPQTEPVTEDDNATADQVDPLNEGDAFRLNAPTVEDNSRLQVDMDVLTETIFELDEAAPQSQYSERNPIPIDPPLPSGLMYKVQIGAFRNAIRQDVFKGISPIIGESTPQGFTRYSAGEFNSFAPADAAKDKIRNIGYGDAFVVAYLNGQRISVAQARAIEGGASVASVVPQGTGTRPQGTTGTGRPQNTGQVQSPTRPAIQPQFIKQGPMEVQAVENIPGSFFTVQVGVYSKPVTSDDIFNISPLLQENLANGLYRYTTGKFNNREDALRARDEARAIGVADAFVTAYRDGVRVAVESLDRGTVTATPPPTRPVTPPTTAPSNNEKYRILLGKYSGEVPVRQASQILLLSGEGVQKISNPDGSSSYYYGSFDSQAAAEQRAEELRNSGLTDAQPEKL